MSCMMESNNCFNNEAVCVLFIVHDTIYGLIILQYETNHAGQQLVTHLYEPQNCM